MAEDFTMSPPESLFIHITSFEPQIIVSQEDNLTAVCAFSLIILNSDPIG